MLRKRPVWLVLGPLLASCGAPAPTETGSFAVDPGYPPATSRVFIDLGGNTGKLCHATLVHPQWALTAGHCFSSAAPDARGSLRDFERGFSSDDVQFHPLAHASGHTKRKEIWSNASFVAAHDLALIPIDPPLDEVPNVAAWKPNASCTLPSPLGVVGEFGQLGPGDVGQTASADVLGPTPATDLLGAGHSGWLLTARGPSVGPGDSGSGLTVHADEIASLTPDCELLADAERVLLGVVQDANPLAPTARFGLVPMFSAEHAEWLAQILESTPPAVPRGPPRLEPMD